MLIFRRAEMPDAPAVTALLEAAKPSLAALGIDQWQRGEPSPATSAADIAAGRCHVGVLDRRIALTYVFLTDGEPDYDEITGGAWIGAENSYAAVHRVTIDREYRGGGLSGAMMPKFLPKRACLA